MFQHQDKDMAEIIGVGNMPKNLPKEKQEPHEILEETDFDLEEQARIGKQQYDVLNMEQKTFVDAILAAVDKNEGGIFAGTFMIL